MNFANSRCFCQIAIRRPALMLPSRQMKEEDHGDCIRTAQKRANIRCPLRGPFLVQNLCEKQVFLIELGLNQSQHWYYMDHGLELIIPILEILEIEVCNILQNPGNIGKRIFLIQSYPGNIGKRIFSNFLVSWKYWKSDFSNFLLSWK